MTSVSPNNILQVVDQNLRKEEKILSNINSGIQWLGKQGISKITLIIALTPPTLYSLFIYLFKINFAYILVFIFIYFVLLYWLLETKFDLVLEYIKKFKTFTSKYV